MRRRAKSVRPLGSVAGTPGRVKIRAGLYRVVGLRCRCGGELQIEKVSYSRDGAWETFCVACKDCDPNGYGTLGESLTEAPAFWKTGKATRAVLE